MLTVMLVAEQIKIGKGTIEAITKRLIELEEMVTETTVQQQVAYLIAWDYAYTTGPDSTLKLTEKGISEFETIMGLTRQHRGLIWPELTIEVHNNQVRDTFNKIKEVTQELYDLITTDPRTDDHVRQQVEELRQLIGNLKQMHVGDQ